MKRLILEGTTPSGRSAFFGMPRSRATADLLRVPPGAYFIALDPATTTRNVSVAVETGDGAVTILRPGRVVLLHGERHVRVWNPCSGGLSAVSAAGSITLGLLGYVGFLAGSSAELASFLTTREDDSHPEMRCLLARSRFVNTGAALVSTENLRGLRLTVIPADASGAPLAAVPADFAATLTCKVRGTPHVNSGLDVADMVTWNPPSSWNEDQPAWNVATPVDTWNLTASGTVCIFDLEVVTPAALVEWTLSGLAGTGVSFAAIIIEGR